jgi:hypothetical protein
MTAVLFGVLALACQGGLRLLHQANPTVSELLFHLLGLVSLGLVGAAYYAVFAAYRRPPATFTAGVSPYNGFGTVIFAWAAGYFFPAQPYAMALTFGVGLLYLLPSVTLTPTHLIVRHVWTRRFAWERIGPGCAVNRRGAIDLEILRPTGKWRYVALGARTRHVDNAFLALAIQEYVEHPERRAQIGSAEELARLKSLPPSQAADAVAEAWPQWLAGE